MTADQDRSVDAPSRADSNSKVARVIREYGLDTIGDELEDQWTRENNRMSLRELADYFNEELLSYLLDENTTRVLDEEASYYYHILTEEEVSSGTRVEVENRLAQHDIDVEQLKDDFVSRQALHTYLTKEREASYQQQELTASERTESRIETVGRLQTRLVSVAERALSEFRQAGLLSNQDADVRVLVQVECTDCHKQYPFSEFLRDGCDCDQ